MCVQIRSVLKISTGGASGWLNSHIANVSVLRSSEKVNFIPPPPLTPPGGNEFQLVCHLAHNQKHIKLTIFKTSPRLDLISTQFMSPIFTYNNLLGSRLAVGSYHLQFRKCVKQYQAYKTWVSMPLVLTIYYSGIKSWTLLSAIGAS